VRASDGENGCEPQGPAEERFRWLAGAARRQPRQVLLRLTRRPFLWLQPTGRENNRAGGLELVAPGHDGRRQGALRRHRRLLSDRLHRRFKEDQLPVLVMHSEDDQIVPYVAAGPLSAKLLKHGTLKTYKDYPHGMPTTHADVINADLLAFIKSS